MLRIGFPLILKLARMIEAQLQPELVTVMVPKVELRLNLVVAA
jgi:hypothetical protein